MKKIIITILAVLLAASQGLSGQEVYRYAQRDTCDLYMDIFRPAEGAATLSGEVSKPTIVYLFGGGFIGGQRKDDFTMKWFKLLNDNGFAVVTIDYRLGMKNYKVGKGLTGALKAVDRFLLSQQVGVEDLFSAISYLDENKGKLGIDTGNIVFAGSSAGAIITLAAVHAIANGNTSGLPEGFKPKGAISFAGAIISTSGAPDFKDAPCPLLLFHGTADKAVAYKHYGIFGKGIWGSDFLAGRLSKKGYPHCIYRFKDRTHDVAAYHMVLWELERQFLEECVMAGHVKTLDAFVDDASLPSWGSLSMGDIYK